MLSLVQHPVLGAIRRRRHRGGRPPLSTHSILAFLPLVLAAPSPAPRPSPTPVRPDPIAALERQLDVSPDHDGVFYDLARALARAGRHADAIRALEKAVALGGDFDPSREPAFAPLSRFEPYRELAHRLSRRAPVSRSSVAFRLKDAELVPEGIAFDPKGGDFYVGSLHRRSILRVDRAGKESVFVPADAGLWAVLGLRVDPDRRLLWAATAADGREGTLRGSAALLAFDLGDGSPRFRAVLPNAPRRHLLNDVVLTPGGDLYATDSESGEIHRLAAGGRALETFLPPGAFVYPNGIARDADGRRLYVADFARGISVVDVATKAVRPLAHPRAISLHGIDGLYARDGSLVAVQNGAGIERIVSFRLDPRGDRVVAAEVLESRNPDFDVPTTGAIAPDGFYYLANAQVQKLGDDGKLVAGAKLAPVLVLRVPLD